MEPCSACPIGTYQSEEGKSNCHSCPAGKATSKTNSTSANDCDFFDVFVNGLPDRTVIGSFRANQTQVLTMSVWLKFRAGLNKENVSIYITDSNSEIVTLQVASEISIQVESG
jgi:hypothetical protein